MERIYLSPPDVGLTERTALLRAFDSGWIAPAGPELEEFEREVAAYVGVAHGAALNSGTAALHLALLLIGVKPGDEVLVPTLTFAATANVVRYLSATPVLVDCDASWNLDATLVEEYLEARARTGKLPAAVVSVDLFGQCADYTRLRRACEPYGVPIIQDAAESLGATWQGERAGAQGVLTAVSFNGNKIITTGGGGMLLSNQSRWVERARFLAAQARDPAPHYEHSELGYNYRLSSLLAAVGRAQLRRIDELVTMRRQVFERYQRTFGGREGWSFMPEAPWGRSNRWLTVALIHPRQARRDRDAVMRALETASIESRPVWKPMHLQPLYRGCRVLRGAHAKELFERGLCLPSGSGLRDRDFERIIAAVETA